MTRSERSSEVLLMRAEGRRSDGDSANNCRIVVPGCGAFCGVFYSYRFRRTITPQLEGTVKGIRCSPCPAP
jgi:hypothetical protein